MSSVIFVTPFVPFDEGHGGNHRAYQIRHDLRLVVGEKNVIPVSFPEWEKTRRTNLLSRVLHRALRRLAYYAENPYKLLAFSYYSTLRYADSKFEALYKDLVRKAPKPVLCVIEDTGFANLIQINSRYNVPTIACMQNLDSLDAGTSRYATQKWSRNATAIDFANEFRILAQCVERLFLSRLDAGLIGGLGLPSHHHAYIPVGAIYRRLQWIRQQRSKEHIEPGLFVMVGNSFHAPTRESLHWFIQNVRKHGLPRGVKVVVCGSATDKLLPPGDALPGLELRGWLRQNELDEIMVRARASLVPQRLGVGALSRLPELSCAGIPVIASRHPTYAMDFLPGMHVVDDHWEAWYTKMEQLAKTDAGSPQDDYYTWVQSQSKTLEPVIKNLLKGL